MTKIVDKMTKDLDLRMYHDGYKERLEALITSKMKGEVVKVKEEKPKKPAAKSMMEVLRETAESLKLPYEEGNSICNSSASVHNPRKPRPGCRT